MTVLAICQPLSLSPAPAESRAPTAWTWGPATCKGLIAELANSFSEIPWDIRETGTYGWQMCAAAAAGRMDELCRTWSRHILSCPAGWQGDGDIPVTHTMAREDVGELVPRE